jgi:hypothetical protein
METNWHYGAYPPGTYNAYGHTLPPDYLQKNDDRYNNDPYAEDVIRAQNYLLSNLQSWTINVADEADDGTTPIPGTNDAAAYRLNTNVNEINPPGLALAALAGSKLAGTASQVAGMTQGKSFEFIVQQMVDYAVYSQIDEDSNVKAIGGWYYSPCDYSGNLPEHAQAYLSNGWCYALYSAEKDMGTNGVYINNRVKTRLPNMLYYSQAPDGSCYMFNSGYMPVFGPVGLTLAACRWLGWDQWAAGDITSAGYPYLNITKGEARQVYDRYFNYIISKWNSAGAGGVEDPNQALWASGDCHSAIYPNNWNGTPYSSNLWTHSLFSVETAAWDFSPRLNAFGSHSWQHDLDVSLIKGQNKTGYYQEHNGFSIAAYFVGTPGFTALSILSGSGNHAPVADAGGGPSMVYSTPIDTGIVLDGNGSYDPDAPSGDSIVSYQWYLDASWLPAAVGPHPTITAAQLNTVGTGAHHVSLRVTDSYGATGISASGLSISPAAGSTQTWYLASTMHSSTYAMGQTVGGQSGSVPVPTKVGAVNGQAVWCSDAAAASSVTYPAGTWTIRLKANEDWAGQCLVSVGTWAPGRTPDGFNAFPGDPPAKSYAGGILTVQFETTASGTVSSGHYLALRVENGDSAPHSVITDGNSRLSAPEGSPGYPVGEIPAGILLGFGLIAIAGYLAMRRRLAIGEGLIRPDDHLGDS